MSKFSCVKFGCVAALFSVAALLGGTSCSDDENTPPPSGGDVEVTSVTILPVSASMEVGETKVFTVTVLPANATDKSYVLESSNESVVVVENNVATAIAAGTANITAKCGDIRSEACQITVNEPEVPFDGIVALNAGAYYKGDQYGTGSDNTFLVLMTDDVITYENTLSGAGKALWIDMNATKTGLKNIPDGTYTAMLEEPGDGESQDFTFLPGVDMGSWGIMGSFIYSLAEGAAAETAEFIMVEDGTVTISVSGSVYTVIASVTAGGESYNFKYEGEIDDASDNVGPGGGEEGEYDEIELTNLTQGEMDYWGQAYGPTGTDYANWTIYLAGADFDFNSFDGSGPLMQIEINTASSATTDITPGTYTVFEEIANTSFVPFSSVPAFIQDNNPLGTWYINELLEATYGATSGTVVISKTGSNYTIEFDFTDAEFMGKFKGTYTGPLSYYDGTASASSASAVVKKSKSSRKLVLNPAKAKRVGFRK